MTSKLFFSTLVALSAQMTFAQSMVDTGSFGEFTPDALIKAEKPWRVFRAVGTVDKAGFPCSSTGGGCSVKKKYVFQKVFKQTARRNGEIGRGEGIFQVDRMSTGTLRTVEIQNLNNTNVARIDQIKATSRLGGDGTTTAEISSFDGFGRKTTLGRMEGKNAVWARINPKSYYYGQGESEKFSLTTVENMMLGGLVQNFFAGTAGKPRMVGGTQWCQSDQWRPAAGILESIVKNDEFDVRACNQNPVMISQTKRDISNLGSNFFFNRVDSRVTLQNSNNYTYDVQSNKEWICFFDCDGSVYRVNLPGKSEMVKITSDRRTWTSSTKFKIKIVNIDWGRDGIAIKDHTVDLRDIANNPAIYKDVAAVIVSEIKDVQNFRGESGNGNYTQHTYIAFPPLDSSRVPQEYMKAIGIVDPTAEEVELATASYQMRVLDAVFAMMPDQIQTSPEIADAEEKLDELRTYTTLDLRRRNSGAISANLLFDVLSEVDATTAASQLQGGEMRRGKIEWLLEVMGEKLR